MLKKTGVKLDRREISLRLLHVNSCRLFLKHRSELTPE